jgi:DNA-binding NarL/FixJ family response regulator
MLPPVDAATPRLLLADDHGLVRDALRGLLERQGFEVVAAVGDGREAVRLAAELRPQVAVLDISMPQLNGLDAAEQIRRAAPETRSVVLTQHREEQYVTRALAAGARGFVLKTQAAADLVRAVEEVLRGGIYLSPEVSQVVVDASLGRRQPDENPLTAREREVLQLIGEGQTSKEIAAKLGISLRTAESHRARLMKKLQIHDVAGLVRYAVRQGVVEA